MSASTAVPYYTTVSSTNQPIKSTISGRHVTNVALWNVDMSLVIALDVSVDL
jgi:hypothetical protein